MPEILKNSILEASLVGNYIPSIKAQKYSMDDSNIDYMSILGLEDKKRRFSEEVVDMDLKDTVRLQKMYRQIQRHVHCHQNKGSWVFYSCLMILDVHASLNLLVPTRLPAFLPDHLS
jgi:hypothetical protein